PHFVHKPCGEELKKSAPEGAQVRLVAGKELAQKFRVSNFWKENFRGKPTAREETATKSPVETEAQA
ncbi:MAG: hypothetical protein Q7R65_01400, partial [bacterium]|nr:hypothetical protein [bacterium]